MARGLLRGTRVEPIKELRKELIKELWKRISQYINPVRERSVAFT